MFCALRRRCSGSLPGAYSPSKLPHTRKNFNPCKIFLTAFGVASGAALYDKWQKSNSEALENHSENNLKSSVFKDKQIRIESNRECNREFLTELNSKEKSEVSEMPLNRAVEIENFYMNFPEKWKIKMDFLMNKQIRIKRMHQRWNNENLSGLTKEQKADVLIKRAEEIKSLYGDTHYVFIHGHTSTILPEMYFINMYMEKETGVKNPLYKHMRINTDKVKKEYKEWKRIREVIKTSPKSINVDCDHSKLILSVDGYFRSKRVAESAYCHLFNNNSQRFRYWSQNHRESLSKNFIGEILEKTHYKHSDRLTNRLLNLSTLRENDDIGVLWVICIPKSANKGEEEVYYSSHTYGKKCNCHRNKDDLILNNLQKNFIDPNLTCYSNSSGIVPQYRLAMPLQYDQNDKPEEHIQTFVLTTMTKSERRWIKDEIIADDSPWNLKNYP